MGATIQNEMGKIVYSDDLYCHDRSGARPQSATELSGWLWQKASDGR